MPGPFHGWLYLVDDGGAVELINHARTALNLQNPDMKMPGIGRIDPCTVLDNGGCDAYLYGVVYDEDSDTHVIESILEDGYAYLPAVSGNYLWTPDEAALDITGDITVIAHVRSAGSYSGYGALVAKWQGANTNSYGLYLVDGTDLEFWWTPDGSTSTGRAATASIPSTSDIWVAATLDVDNGAGGHSARFYTSTDGVTWTQLGSTVTTAGTTSIFSGTSYLSIGGEYGGSSSLFQGTIYEIQIRNGIGTAGVPGGTLVFQARMTDLEDGITSFTANTGQTVTVNQTGTAPAQIVGRSLGEAPWLSIKHPESADVIGFWIEEWTGLDDAHIARNVQQRGSRIGGGQLGPLRANERVMKLNVLVLARTEKAMEYAYRWLERTLNSICSSCATHSALIKPNCGGEFEDFFWLPRGSHFSTSSAVIDMSGDPDADWRVRLRVPPPSAGLLRASRVWSGGVFLQVNADYSIYASIHADNDTFPSAQTSAGTLTPGEVVDIRGTWDATGDVMRAWWRPAQGDLTDDDGWILGSQNTHAGRSIKSQTVRAVHGGVDVGGDGMEGAIYGVALQLDGVDTYRLSASDCLAQGGNTIFTAPTGQTVWLIRSTRAYEASEFGPGPQPGLLWESIRELRQVGLIEGMQWESDPADFGRCKLRRLSFSLAAGDPCMYGRCSDEVDSITPLDDQNIGNSIDLVPNLLPCRPSCLDTIRRLVATFDVDELGAVGPIVEVYTEDFPSLPGRLICYGDPGGVYPGTVSHPCGLEILGELYIHPLPAWSSVIWDVPGRAVWFQDSSTGGPVPGGRYIAPNDAKRPRFFTLPCGTSHVVWELASRCLEDTGSQWLDENGSVGRVQPGVTVKLQERMGCP